ncbi:MAG: hypothetical protein QXP39_03145 [Candidatus Aenigmatarchaeota archaeon]
MDITEIPNYGYRTTAQAHATDENICAFLIQSLRETKKVLFRTIHMLYEMQLEGKINQQLQGLWDAVDVFSDEIKIRVCRWRPLPDIWIAKLEAKDKQLIDVIKKINRDVNDIFNFILNGLKKDHRVKTQPILYEGFWDECRKRISVIEGELEEAVRLFKERDAICNLKPLSLQKTYELIKTKIS